MRRFATIVTFVSLLATTAAGPVYGAGHAAPSERGWIVNLRGDDDPGVEARRLLRDLGTQPKFVFRHALKGFSFRGSAAAAAALARNPKVRTVVADGSVSIAAETTPVGIKRILASHPDSPDAHDSGFTGAGVRVGVIDTGIDLDHPDLVANLDTDLGKNCYSTGPPEDGHGHGTHVAGTIAAVGGNQIGVVGVAPDARLVPLKALSDSGTGEWSNVICAIDHLTALATDGDPGNDVRVVNMSIGDAGPIGACDDGGLRQAICTSVAAGIAYVAAAGNSNTDAGSFIPAAFPEVVAVSATADWDGEPGGLGGCRFVLLLFDTFCDDARAQFSNYGPAVDIAAPGVEVYSSYAGGGYQNQSGTSMAAPHVAGVAALVRAANPGLTPAQVANVLVRSGTYPDGSLADGGCPAVSTWPNDPDGITEPLVSALRATQFATGGGGVGLPIVTLTSPSDGATLDGPVALAASASDPNGITSVEFLVDGMSVGSDTVAPYTASWHSDEVADGIHTIVARATDGSAATACHSIEVTTGNPSIQGDWVGTYGSAGYVLAAWNGGTSDVVALPSATMTLEQGARHYYGVSTETRAVENAMESERRKAVIYDAVDVRIRLDFSTGFSGPLDVYAVDNDSTSRRQTMTVDDGSGPVTRTLGTAFSQGAWVHYSLNVAPGGSATVVAHRTGGSNAVISGIFLGGPGAPPAPDPTPTPSPTATPTPTPVPTPTPPPPPVEQPGVAGDWVDRYGSAGYILPSWLGSDVVALPNASLTVEQGARYYYGRSGEARAVENAAQTERRKAVLYHATEIRLRLDFPTGFSGPLDLYAVDYDSTARRQTLTVDDGSGLDALALTTSFSGGAWLHFNVDVAPGGSVNVTATRTAGGNAVISGIFLGGPGSPPPAAPPARPPLEQPGLGGDWVGTYGSAGYVLNAWNGATDVVSLPTASMTLLQGTRYSYGSSTEIRAVENVAMTERRRSVIYHASEVRLRFEFPGGYSGPLDVYAVDYDSTARRQTVTVDDGSGPVTRALTTAFSNGAWLHYTVDVVPGGSVSLTATRTAGGNAVLSGIFLGGPGAPTPEPTPAPTPEPTPAPTPTIDQPGVQGDWVGVYGSQGYVLAAWNSSSDVVSLNGATRTLVQGSRHRWSASTAQVRALENAAQSQRRAATYFHATEVRVRIDFSTAFVGRLHIYALDWDSNARRQTVALACGAETQSLALTNSFDQGAWLHFPVTAAAGTSCTITATRTAGGNAVISGIFLGG